MVAARKLGGSSDDLVTRARSRRRIEAMTTLEFFLCLDAQTVASLFLKGVLLLAHQILLCSVEVVNAASTINFFNTIISQRGWSLPLVRI